jgi:hypothetical protein
MLAELRELVATLESHSRAVRARSKDEVIDGYPTKSLPESSIASGRLADPTAATVERLAGGKFDETEEGVVTTPDHWKGPPDPVGTSVNRMHSETVDARNRLWFAVAAMRSALPPHRVEKVAEVCVSCGTNKAIAGDWVVTEGKCGSCSRRHRRHREPAIDAK